MACERYLEAVTELAAGGPAVAGLEAHLDGCEGCREELDTLQRALAAVDAELRQLVATEPSPELAARIRRGAAEPSASPAWRPGFQLQVLAAAAVLVATLVVMRGRSPAPPPAVAVATRVPQASGATPLPGPTAAPVIAAATPRPAASPRPREEPVPSIASARRAASPEPEVVVPPGQMEALVRFAAIVNRQDIASPVLAALDRPAPDLAEPRPIDVGSIDIKPLEMVPLDAAETTGT